MTIAYLAARYSRFPEMQTYREQLAQIGIHVTARWVNGEHEKVDGIASREQSQQFALDDVTDLLAADILISFTEDPTAGTVGRGRGGRHVEFGMAWVIGKRRPMRLIVVGYRENVFHDLPEVEFFETWDECLNLLWRTADLDQMARMGKP